MKYDKFVGTMLMYREVMDDLSELHRMGFDFFEGKFDVIDCNGFMYCIFARQIHSLGGLERTTLRT